MDMPQPTDAHRRLEPLVGHWTGTETVAPHPGDPEGATAQADVRNRASLGGFIVVQDYVQSRGGEVHFGGHGVFSHDGQKYQLHWWDLMGSPPDIFSGDFEGDVLKLQSATAMGHARCSFDLSQSDGYAFTMEMSQDGKDWFAFMQGAYARAD